MQILHTSVPPYFRMPTQDAESPLVGLLFLLRRENPFLDDNAATQSQKTSALNDPRHERRNYVFKRADFLHRRLSLLTPLGQVTMRSRADHHHRFTRKEFDAILSEIAGIAYITAQSRMHDSALRSESDKCSEKSGGCEIHF